MPAITTLTIVAGDFNRDGLFSSDDFVEAFSDGGYQLPLAGARNTASRRHEVEAALADLRPQSQFGEIARIRARDRVFADLRWRS